MYAQAVITLLLLIVVICLFKWWLFPKKGDKGKEESEELSILRERVESKTRELEKRRAELGLLKSEVDTTGTLVGLENELKEITIKLKELEQQLESSNEEEEK